MVAFQSDIRQNVVELMAQVSSLVRARTPSPPVISASESRIAAAVAASVEDLRHELEGTVDNATPAIMASGDRAPAKYTASELAASSKVQPTSPRPGPDEAVDALMR